MNSDVFSKLRQYAETVREPGNLFSGLRLPPHFRLPDNLLVFFHNFTAPVPNSHGRHTVVIPFDRMTYYVERYKVQLEPGRVLLVPPYAMRFLHPDSEGFRRLFITFDQAGEGTFSGLHDLTADAGEYLLRFLDFYASGAPENAVPALVLFLNSLVLREERPVEQQIPLKLEKAVEFIESNLHTPLVLKEVAENSGLSESHMRTMFRNEFGVSLGRYIAKKRLDAAKYRLTHSDMNISGIAQSCGFANVFVFGAFFKRNTGVSPMKFRRENAVR